MTVTCRVLKLSRQPYYRWLDAPITKSEVVEAYRANALFNAHKDDPEFGHRLLAGEARDAGEAMSDRTAWRIASANGWWSAFGKKRGRNGKKPGPPVHDDLCAVLDEDGRTRHVFAAEAPNQLWLVDITEHRTAEGKLYCCAIKDACSGRIVGYSIDSRMKSRLAVQALENAALMRGATSPAASSTAIEAVNSAVGRCSAPWPGTAWSGAWEEWDRAGTTPPWNRSSRSYRKTSSTAAPGPPASSFASRSSPGSSEPITGDAVRHAWVV
ncbi:hypothetical protein GCM10010401_09360 [Rarobacter faecitabidus]